MEKKKSQILQHNKILLGGQTINLRARQMIYVLARFIDKKDPYAILKLNVKEFLDFFNSNSKEKWTDVYALTNDIFTHLNDNPILLKKPKKRDYVKINWLSSLGVQRGFIEARFSTDIIEFFLYQEKHPYTNLLWDLRLYKSGHTARIVELFQKYHRKNSGDTEIVFEYDLEDLKFFFGVHDKYPRFFDFNKRILQATKNELDKNDIIPYWFDYKKLKRGRTVVGIKFTVYVRSEILLKAAPELTISASTPPSLFDTNAKSKFTEGQKKILNRLKELDLPENQSKAIVNSLTEPQAIGCCLLIEYGVNKNLALNIITKFCSFGEIVGREHFYVKHSLELIETARLKRIKEQRQTGSKNKRTTPDHKKGGLPKSVFEKKQHFPSFMEKLSTIRQQEHKKQRTNPKSSKTGGMQSMSDILSNYKVKK
ncbi:MAG: RepB family plasmid replication initiator protein [Saprospiraceae bacterium]